MQSWEGLRPESMIFSLALDVAICVCGSFSACDNISGRTRCSVKFFHFSAVFSQTVGGGSGHGQGDGCHGADKSLHQPAGQESTCQSQWWVSRLFNNSISGDVLLTNTICYKLHSFKKMNTQKKKLAQPKPVICMFCDTLIFYSLTAVIMWMHVEA